MFSLGKRDLRRDVKAVFKYIETAVERMETNYSSYLLEIKKKYNVLKTVVQGNSGQTEGRPGRLGKTSQL